jgi:starvation-inducible DNA-binding protein
MIAGLEPEAAKQVAELLQDRLVALNDLQLTLKHVHWNVVGPNFIGVHRMLDPQVDAVRTMVDEAAERIATLGYEPLGTAGTIVRDRTWDDYPLNRAGTSEHMAALDVTYARVIGGHRAAIAALDTLDLVTQDILISHSEQMEQFQWFARAHLESASGRLPYSPDAGQEEAVRAASVGAPTWSRPSG